MVPTLLAPVVPSEIIADEPLPYNIYLANKTLLAHRNEKLSAPDRLEILRQQGWRIIDDVIPENALPLQDAAQQLEFQPAVLMTPLPPQPLADSTALIADDMRLTRRSLERLLRLEGVGNVIGADSGADAVTLFFQQHIHLVFLDIDMPGVDGIDALRQIKRWSPNTFVCLVTGVATVANLKLAQSYGLDTCLAKPINTYSLKKALALYTGIKQPSNTIPTVALGRPQIQ
ncbi:response regulator [Thiospirillum jenense]|uniref:Response regulator n=1 Tax=Thiospirillum jenense TaxID=1653858 RepID=A0A839HJ50_9GAMM|nr:response regulator [Thiospirillum jenense]MBB1126669.1 response regulator [Thiospirillum jenense]